MNLQQGDRYMNILQRIIHNTSPKKNIQAKNTNRNRAALLYLQKLGFFMPEIRKALLDLNGIRLKHMVCRRATFGTLSRTNVGTLKNRPAQIIIAEKLKLTVKELFPYD